MAARGHRVLFVESTGLRSPSIGSSHDWRRVIRRLRDAWRPPREVAQGLSVLSPAALPLGWGEPARRLALQWLRRAVRSAARRLALRDPVIWSFLPTPAPVVDLFGGRLIVYHCVDHYAANPGVPRRWVERMERLMVDRADVVFATSPALAERLRRESGREIILVPNVADVALFSRAVTENLQEPPDLARIHRPRAVYIGNLAAYRIDLPLLDQLAATLGDVSFIVIGAVGLGDPGRASPPMRSLLGRPNVHLIDARPQPELPAYLRHCDVGLIPFLDNEHTRGSLPLKLWEYAAAGLPVVATDLPNFAGAAAEGAVLPARGCDAFAAMIRDALRDDGSRRDARLALARRHDWPLSINTLCHAIGRALEQGSRPSAPGDS
jgi:glycosyltransferase involved in cell wall biosynthesis